MYAYYIKHAYIGALREKSGKTWKTWKFPVELHPYEFLHSSPFFTVFPGLLVGPSQAPTVKFGPVPSRAFTLFN